VVQARGKVAQTTLPPDVLTNPDAFKAYEQNQAALSTALSRLLVVVERYPDLKANQNFLVLQSQLEGTENRIAVARRDYIGAVQRYNTELKTFPGVIWKTILYSSSQPMQTFSISEDAMKAPSVKF
jgi:LemA protein